MEHLVKRFLKLIYIKMYEWDNENDINNECDSDNKFDL